MCVRERGLFATVDTLTEFVVADHAGRRNVPTIVIGFITKVDRDDHFQSHNPEFKPPFASAADYEAAGVAFLSGALTGNMMECVRRNGDIVRYDRATSEFAICDSYGALRTYYKPDPAVHKQKDNVSYFRGQCLK